MNQRKSLIIFFCLVSICGFGKEALKFPQKDISIRVQEDEQLIEVPSEELFAKSETVTLYTASKDDEQEEIVYPIEESNFEEVFGSN